MRHAPTPSQVSPPALPYPQQACHTPGCAAQRAKPGLALLLTAAVLSLAACGQRGQDAAKAPAAAAPQAPAAMELSAADLYKVQSRAMTDQVGWTGSIKAKTQAIVRAKVAGELTQLLPREGESVAKGQVIARIDPLDAELRIREREALVVSAEASVDNAQRQRDNNRRLLDQGFISQNAYDSADSSLQVAKAQRDAAQAQLAQAKKAMNDTLVRAPIAGLVAERTAQPGEKVGVDAKLLTLIDPRSIDIEAAIQASDIARVKVGQTASVLVEGFTQPIDAKVTRINPATTGASRTVLAYLSPVAAAGRTDMSLRIGLFAQGDVMIAQRQVERAVQAGAIRDAASSQPWVLAIRDGVLVKQSVKLGLKQGDGSQAWVELLDGPKAGDVLVSATLTRLQDGQKVRLPGTTTTKPAPSSGAAATTGGAR